MGQLIAICVSDKRGIGKTTVPRAVLEQEFGLSGDAHAGKWHRQISILSLEKIEEFTARGARVEYGNFGENLVISGFDFRNMPVGSRFIIGDALIEMTQIGKECHSHCAIYHQVGDCIMPREGVFARVITGGEIAVGDEVVLVEREAPRLFTAAVVTVSDRASRGEYEDKSGALIALRLSEQGYEVIEKPVIPDEAARIENELIRLADGRQADLIITTGGTGFAPRDVTPEATMKIAHRKAPGISEAMRAHSLNITPNAMLSRGVSVIRGQTLIINLPGSPKACEENMDCFMAVLPHALGLLKGKIRQG